MVTHPAASPQPEQSHEVALLVPLPLTIRVGSPRQFTGLHPETNAAHQSFGLGGASPPLFGTPPWTSTTHCRSFTHEGPILGLAVCGAVCCVLCVVLCAVCGLWCPPASSWVGAQGLRFDRSSSSSSSCVVCVLCVYCCVLLCCVLCGVLCVVLCVVCCAVCCVLIGTVHSPLPSLCVVVVCCVWCVVVLWLCVVWCGVVVVCCAVLCAVCVCSLVLCVVV